MGGSTSRLASNRFQRRISLTGGRAPAPPAGPRLPGPKKASLRSYAARTASQLPGDIHAENYMGHYGA